MLTLLTMTGGRPEAFALCERWMARQTYTGPVRWVVVDDGEVAQPISFARDGWQVDVLRPTPFWAPGQNTQARNIKAGLDAIGNADVRLVIIEDDDWYGPEWLATVDKALNKHELVGESHARYYNVAQRRAKQLENFQHASLCSTAMRGRAIEQLKGVCRPGIQFIDVMLWQAFGNEGAFRGENVVGIKGLPGRKGIGIGHDKRFQGTADKSGKILRSWVGEDVAAYLAPESPDE